MSSASCVPRLANTASDRGGNGTRKLRTGLAIGLAERLPHLRADVRCWNCGGAGRLFDGRGRGGIRARVHVHQLYKEESCPTFIAPRCVAFGTKTGQTGLVGGPRTRIPRRSLNRPHLLRAALALESRRRPGAAATICREAQEPKSKERNRPSRGLRNRKDYGLPAAEQFCARRKRKGELFSQREGRGQRHRADGVGAETVGRRRCRMCERGDQHAGSVGRGVGALGVGGIDVPVERGGRSRRLRMIASGSGSFFILLYTSSLSRAFARKTGSHFFASRAQCDISTGSDC